MTKLGNNFLTFGSLVWYSTIALLMWFISLQFQFMFLNLCWIIGHQVGNVKLFQKCFTNKHYKTNTQLIRDITKNELFRWVVSTSPQEIWRKINKGYSCQFNITTALHRCRQIYYYWNINFHLISDSVS